MPHMYPDPRRGPAEMPGPFGGPAFLSNSETRESLPEWIDLVQSIIDAVRESSGVELNHVPVKVPAMVDSTIRFERTPKGRYALVLRAEWDGQDAAGGSSVGPMIVRPLMPRSIEKEAV